MKHEPSLTVQKTSRVWSVVRVSSGNFLEMYDFMVFGYYASAIAGALVTGNRAVPGLWLSFAAGCGLIAAVLAQPYAAPAVQEPELCSALRLEEHV
ncbi:MAG: hypothetical protein ABMA15_23635 [Vicinamibacterales bacterium]